MTQPPVWTTPSWVPELEVVSLPLLAEIRAQHLRLLERRSGSAEAAEDLRRVVERMPARLDAEWPAIGAAVADAKAAAADDAERRARLDSELERLNAFVRNVLGDPGAEVDVERAREFGWGGAP